jgi:hypothetical protein
MALDAKVVWKALCPTWDGTGNINPVQAKRDEQIEIITLPSGKKRVKFKVQFGDNYTNPSGVTYSEVRALMTGPDKEWIKPNETRVQRWKISWPKTRKPSYPKQDELFKGGHTLTGGASVVNHHQPDGGGTESGSAPFYFEAMGDNVVFRLVEQVKDPVTGNIISRTRDGMEKKLVAYVPEYEYDFVLRATWSPDPAVGSIEFWVDGKPVPLNDDGSSVLRTWNMYPGTQMYPVVGDYRRESIGNPNLKWPDGTQVYPLGDLEPDSVTMGEWQSGPTLESVGFIPTITTGVPVAIPPVAPPADGIDPLTPNLDRDKVDAWRRSLIGLVYAPLPETGKLSALLAKIDAQLALLTAHKKAQGADHDILIANLTSIGADALAFTNAQIATLTATRAFIEAIRADVEATLNKGQ